ncbi:MAG TPA: hypothetical protein VNT99_08295 [Methylomirabilota bacterium]|nr:hypothetical protein [Methylomirabilota bacterium]
MYRSLSDAQVKDLHSSALAARLEGTRVFKWNSGDTGAENMLTLNLADPNTWAQIDAEYCMRFGGKRRSYRRTTVNFS